MSVFVWSMVGIALWHFTIFVPDRFAGGIIGAFLAAWLGAMASGFVLEGLEVPEHNPPGLKQALLALPGSVGGLVACYLAGHDPHERADAEAAVRTEAAARTCRPPSRGRTEAPAPLT